MEVQFQPGGIYLPAHNLWLDPAERGEAAWLSHAHGDHARGGHGRAWATPATMEIYGVRWPEQPGELRQVVQFGESFEWQGARCTAFPAGHILGAAQLLVEDGGERLVYTGDIKLRAPLCGAATEVVPCDRLIIECTFGLPIYHFLEAGEAARRMVEFARQCLDDGVSPVFYGYALGRGQEIAHVLARAQVPVSVHGAVARFIPHYERAGYTFDGWSPYEAGRTKGKALVVTNGMRNILEAGGRGFRVAYVSGWAALANARARVGAEALIPYSDHGDFNELVEMIERSGAQRVDLVHGYTEAFARILRQRGIAAFAHGAQQATEAEADS
jgi:Cft2 family RNA processing exonuclease